MTLVNGNSDKNFSDYCNCTWSWFLNRLTVTFLPYSTRYMSVYNDDQSMYGSCNGLQPGT